MNKQLIYRVVLDILIITCVLHAWWFIALPLALVGVWRFSYFIEIVFAGAIYDCLFGLVSEMRLLGYIGTIISIGVFAIVVLVRRSVRGGL